MTTREMGLPAQWTRALERAKSEGIYVVDATMHTDAERVDAIVISPSSGTRYATMVESDARGIVVGCDCKGAERGYNCKHVAQLLRVTGILH